MHHTKLTHALAFQSPYHTCNHLNPDLFESLSFSDGRLSLAGVAGRAPAALLWCESEQSSTRSSKKSIPLQPLDPPTSHLVNFHVIPLPSVPLPSVPLHRFLQQLSSTTPQSSSHSYQYICNLRHSEVYTAIINIKHILRIYSANIFICALQTIKSKLISQLKKALIKKTICKNQ